MVHRVIPVEIYIASFLLSDLLNRKKILVPSVLSLENPLELPLPHAPTNSATYIKADGSKTKLLWPYQRSESFILFFKVIFPWNLRV